MVLKSGRTQRSVAAEDVSNSGVFVVTSLALPVRQLVQLEARLDTDEFAAHAMVVFLRPEREGKAAGLGLKFFGLSRNTLERWARFVRGVRERELVAPPRAPRAEASRAAVVLRLRPHGVDALIEVYTRDIAEGGMFVETDQPLLVGSRLLTELIHPDTGEAFELESIVRRVVAGGKPGIGVEFAALDAQRREDLHEFVSSMAPPLVIGEPEEG